MAANSQAEPPPLEVLSWLKSLPMAPEYHPTLAEFQDPIAFILKIEKEASAYGICKIVPPVPPAAKKTTMANLNRSFAARDPNPKKPPTFTTRQQQIGFCPRRPRPVQKPVWQSGEQYTLQQFEAKAKQFEKSHLRKLGKRGLGLSPLEIETLFWKACADKPFSVEYANDMPGSGFAPLASGKKWREDEAANVGETAWNMRGVSRAKGSLLRFMKEEIPGVTSPMVYIAMMFSWFAWHVEDHDLHSLNYLHFGAGKTWYGVPRDARLALEDVIRVHGYCGEVNPLVTFAILTEKTTVMSPEILVGAGIPCCRLVQNAGEFVVTFPGAYHTGFSHGFNCGEAANIATPQWLRFAKEAAVRRASTNFPPMVSHFQLLYALALSLGSRMPMVCCTEPRSSRLKDKMKGEGEVMVKTTFVQSVAQNNNLLSVLLEKGSTCVVLPRKTAEISLCSTSLVKPQLKVKPRLSLGLCSRQEGLEASGILPSDDAMPDRNMDTGHSSGFCLVNESPVSAFQGKKLVPASFTKYETSDFCSSSSESQYVEGGKESTIQGDGLLEQGLLSCVTCGILSFSCVAVIQPREKAARYLMASDCSVFSDHIVASGDTSETATAPNQNTGNYDLSRSGPSTGAFSGTANPKSISALDLLASAYGDLSEPEDDVLDNKTGHEDGNEIRNLSLSSDLTQKSMSSTKVLNGNLESHLIEPDCQTETNDNYRNSSSGIGNYSELPVQDSGRIGGSDDSNDSPDKICTLKLEFSRWNQPDSPNMLVSLEDEMAPSDCLIAYSTGINEKKTDGSCHKEADFPEHHNSCDPVAPIRCTKGEMKLTNYCAKIQNSDVPVMQRSDKDSSRMHVFCLEHAVEVEKQLRPFGGVHIMLLCHPDYPRIEAEAKLLATELGSDIVWKDIPFLEAKKEDQLRIRSAMEDEESIPMNSDWAVKMGINLYYSANLSKSPLYCKQMPYNAVIYKAFGCNSAGNSPVKLKATGRRPGRQKKIVVAGKWCGKVWMSNQVHPHLAHRQDTHEQEFADKIYSGGSDEKPKIEKDSAVTEQAARPSRNSSSTAAARKSGKKRKKTLNKASIKKARHTATGDSSLEVAKENSSAQCSRLLRSRIKHNVTPLKNENTSQRKLNLEDEADGGPSTRLRRRPSKTEATKSKPRIEKHIKKKKGNKVQEQNSAINKEEELDYPCDVEGCSMSFGTKQDLSLHKRNICPVKGCGKKFFSHKYLVQHRKVHLDDRPLKCPWKGCKMTFKWAWARTEHIRVHTGDRPYVCREAGCGQTFRFVSDFSRHKRKTGHSVKKVRR
ncbi:[histone H3]-lysine-36 demethylase protein [Dioscorea alata]|uniref:[histone H3]-lysine-36 demethylase protein n=1 Tax=Dioscorea alata TaxID=55571 RepID=A0ACB7WAP5_DIOAL|nr:[histone H3]-lysine-36 demethylase protein [Dioscorea alata]